MKTLSISQTSYLEGVLKKFNMNDCKPVSTPMEPGAHFQKRTEEETPFDKQLYQQAVGCLTYASTSTRPDISAALGVYWHSTCQTPVKTIGVASKEC